MVEYQIFTSIYHSKARHLSLCLFEENWLNIYKDVKQNIVYARVGVLTINSS